MARILSVGQCGYDHGSIASVVRRGLGADVVSADTFTQARKLLSEGSFDLVLVNRVTDADGTSGHDLIATLKADPSLQALPVMLVSNYPDAQAEAERLGALTGFGKSDLHGSAAIERIRAALGAIPKSAT